MKRNYGLSQYEGLSSRTALVDGGVPNTQSGSRGANAIQFGAENVIQFPPAVFSLRPAANSRASERELSISDDTGAICALAVVFSCSVVALSTLLYAGYKLFFLFDLG